MMTKIFEKILILVSTISCIFGLKCPFNQVHFEKIIGYRPSTSAIKNENIILCQSYNQIPSIINLQCMEKCKNDHNCEGYVLNVNLSNRSSECYAFISSEQGLESHNFQNFNDHELEEDKSVIFFIKTCMNSRYTI